MGRHEAEPIVVAVDDSPNSTAAVRWAARESMLRGAPVRIVHALAPGLEGGVGPRSGIHLNDREVAERILVDAEGAFRAERDPVGMDGVSVAVLEGAAVDCLVDASKQAQMIVVGTRGLHAAGRMLLGSVSAAVIHRAHCPVAVIPLPAQRPLPPGDDPVLVGVDHTDANGDAISLAFDEASRRGAKLVVVHAWSDVGIPPVIGEARWHDREAEMRARTAERLAPWREERPGVDVELRVVCDVPAHALTFESRYSQLVVVGGRRGGSLGSVSSAVVSRSETPVIVALER
ncbi:universal stress protein [Mycolicibacterium lacusdiani]|uniref:universal stress protein n=1 Tax=Mycolicibacterium lacusdiani TaxID=2895283 RepID=UPI001F2A285F|nr:universal stress protein [Mycolicibacterium lacusdiani]